MIRDFFLILLLSHITKTSNKSDALVNKTVRLSINTTGCNIPYFKPFHKYIPKNFTNTPRIFPKCHEIIPLLRNNESHIWIIWKNVDYYYMKYRERLKISGGSDFNATAKQDLKCCYRSFYRPLSTANVLDHLVNHRVSYRDCKYFKSIVAVSRYDEFVKVICFIKNVKVSVDYFLFTPKKKLHRKVDKCTSTLCKKGNSFNVLVIGFDNMSRLNFHRTMPNTLGYLKQLGAVEFLGYSQIAHFTSTIVTAILTGVEKNNDSHELCATLWNEEYVLDECPFVWKWFENSGYYTAYSDDIPSNFGPFEHSGGFLVQPTHYYPHTLLYQAYNDNSTARNPDTPWCPWCIRNKYSYEIIADYIAGLSSLKNKRLFGFFWEMTFSHFGEHMNLPILMDKVYAKLCKKLYDSGYLNDTVLIFLSDHGMRHGNVAVSNIGIFESKLPFLYIVVPPLFRKLYRPAFQNLLQNRHRLVTAFDIHETLVDLTNLSKITRKSIYLRIADSYSGRRGISLFLEIPENRTCEMAHIRDVFCPCLSDDMMFVENEDVGKASAAVVDVINVSLENYSQCSKLKLAATLQAWELSKQPHSETKGNRTKMHVRIVTIPGYGVFEAIVIMKDGGFKVVDPVIRVSAYGRQGYCVKDSSIKVYCFCK